MKCLVTAGPTFEPLDQVRRLTNFSTGKLGSELANFLTGRGHEVMLLLGEQATWPEPVKAQSVLSFSTTADLRAKLEKVSGDGFGAVFHAAAVSDFGFGKVWQRKTWGELVEVRSGKFRTDLRNLLVELNPTAKIIAELRNWFPSGLLVGWKFEVEGDRDSVLEKARKQIKENRTDACVANGPAYGEGFGLVHASGAIAHTPSCDALFIKLDEMLHGVTQATSPSRSATRRAE